MENMEGIESKTEGAIGPPKDFGHREIRKEGLLEASDVEGFAQLAFHLGCLAICAMTVSWAYEHGYWGLLLLAQVPFGIAESFLFNGFHEMVHNTAFKTQALNTIFANILGFENFRGARWFWCFHWTHHRYTNDPLKDPELSGESVDLDDPTKTAWGYAQFLSGYPFGFERIARMGRIAAGSEVDPWVAEKPESMQRAVRIEAAVYLVGYLLLAIAGLFQPRSVGMPLVLYWLLPHCFGAGHLRMYQFAEHRACQMGAYTDTNAWICARTSYTWWLYRKLAWQMPFHVEHHAFPNVPFHKLEAAHAMLKKAYKRQGLKSAPTGCNPNGEDGYLSLHRVMFKRMLSNVATAGKAAKAA